MSEPSYVFIKYVLQGEDTWPCMYFFNDCFPLSCSLKLQPHRLARFLKSIEAGYVPTIPYHNAIHACDVLQVTPALLEPNTDLRACAACVHNLLAACLQFACQLRLRGRFKGRSFGYSAL